MPELVGKWYTRAASIPQSQHVPERDIQAPEGSSQSESRTTWCYCNGEEEGKMIACDDDQCLIQWFHTSCLKITNVPKGKWFCPDCRKKEGKCRKGKKS